MTNKMDAYRKVEAALKRIIQWFRDLTKPEICRCGGTFLPSNGWGDMQACDRCGSDY